MDYRSRALSVQRPSHFPSKHQIIHTPFHTLVHSRRVQDENRMSLNRPASSHSQHEGELQLHKLSVLMEQQIQNQRKALQVISQSYQRQISKVQSFRRAHEQRLVQLQQQEDHLLLENQRLKQLIQAQRQRSESSAPGVAESSVESSLLNLNTLKKQVEQSLIKQDSSFKSQLSRFQNQAAERAVHKQRELELVRQERQRLLCELKKESCGKSQLYRVDQGLSQVWQQRSIQFDIFRGDVQRFQQKIQQLHSERKGVSIKLRQFLVSDGQLASQIQERCLLSLHIHCLNNLNQQELLRHHEFEEAISALEAHVSAKEHQLIKIQTDFSSLQDQLLLYESEINHIISQFKVDSLTSSLQTHLADLEAKVREERALNFKLITLEASIRETLESRICRTVGREMRAAADQF